MNHTNSLRRYPLAVCLILAAAAPVCAANLHTAIDGVDGPDCGPKGAACRTISQAIDNASAGDTVIVGPGVYGDINRNGVFGEAGEEPDRDCGGGPCVLLIDKPLTVVSEAGAFSTLLEGGEQAPVVVVLTAPGVTLGAKNKGFTLQNEVPNVAAIGILIEPGSGSNVIAGNVFVTDSVGQAIVGRGEGGDRILDNRFPMKSDAYAIYYAGDDAEFRRNTISGVTAGFYISNSARPVISENVVVGATFGIYLANVTDAVVSKCSLVGNTRAIAAVGGGTVTVDGSNLFGRTYADDCTIEATSADVTATRCFWGDAAGPGPYPVGGICTPGTALSTPFATKAHKIKPKPLR